MCLAKAYGNCNIPFSTRNVVAIVRDFLLVGAPFIQRRLSVRNGRVFVVPFTLTHIFSHICKYHFKCKAEM